MWIMVGGPYGTGAKSAAERAANLARMNEAALAVWRKGHVPIIGVNLALPIVAAAGGDAAADAEIMMPLSLALAERCDAFLRIGGRLGRRGPGDGAVRGGGEAGVPLCRGGHLAEGLAQHFAQPLRERGGIAQRFAFLDAGLVEQQPRGVGDGVAFAARDRLGEARRSPGGCR